MKFSKASIIILATVLISACNRDVEKSKNSPPVSENTIQSHSTNNGPQPINVKELAICSSKENSIQRLNCFDDLAKKYNQVSKTIDTSSKSKGAWITSTETDPLTDKSIYFAQIDATEGKGRFGDRISMTVRCKKGKTEAYIDWATFLGSDEIRVTSRVDKSTAITNSWSLSTDHKASFMPQAANTLKKFVGATSFVVNLTPYSESPITALFDITGAEEAFADIRRECKW
jgi:type VI secretion system protein VasI